MPLHCEEDNQGNYTDSFNGAFCPKFHYTIELIGKRWTGAIIHIIMADTRRFHDIRDMIPQVSDRMLSERLKELEQAGLIQRTVYPETPVRIEYSISEKGLALKPVMDEISTWSATHVSQEDLSKF